MDRSGLKDLLGSFLIKEETISIPSILPTARIARVILELRSANVQQMNAKEFGEFAEKHEPDLFEPLQNCYVMSYLDLCLKPSSYIVERDCAFFLLNGTLDLQASSRFSNR